MTKPFADNPPDTTDTADARAVAEVCTRLLKALHAGAPGAQLAKLLNAAGTLLATNDVALMHDGDRLTANGTLCHPESSALLRETMVAHGVRRIVLTRATSARELLQLMALLVDPPGEATGAIANLWGAHGAWRIRLELTGETSARLLAPGTKHDVGSPRVDVDENGRRGDQRALAGRAVGCLRW